MAVSETLISKRLQVVFNTGMDAEFNPIYSTRSWSNINTGASALNLMTLAQHLDGLCEHTMYLVRVAEVTELEEQ